MSKILVLIGVVLIAFVLGFLGIYLAMPYISPEKYEKTTAMIDSIKASEALNNLPDSALKALPDHILDPVTDSLYTSIHTLDSTLANLNEQHQETVSFLRDSLQAAHLELASIKKLQQSLSLQINALDERLKMLEAQRLEVKDLSATLPKLEDDELSAILQQLDMNLLEMLFSASTSRNQSRILKALTAEQAARFVAFLVKGNNAGSAVQDTAEPRTSPAALANTNDEA